MKQLLKAKDSYTYPNDLYKKRGFSWTTKMCLSNTIQISSSSTNYDYYNWRNPALTVETRKHYVLNAGKIGIAMKCEAEYEGEATSETNVTGHMRCRMWVGDKVYGKFHNTPSEYEWHDGSAIQNWENFYFDIFMGNFDKHEGEGPYYCKTSEVSQKCPITVYGKGAEGYQIPVSEALNGKIKFEIISWRNGNLKNIDQPITISLSFVKQDTEVQKDSNAYEKKISAYQHDEYTISTKYCTIKQENGWTNNAVITSNGDYLQNVTIEDGQQGQDMVIENCTMWRAYNHYRIPRKVLTISVRYDKTKSYSQNQTIVYRNENFSILCADYNWRDSTVKLTLIKL